MSAHLVLGLLRIVVSKKMPKLGIAGFHAFLCPFRLAYFAAAASASRSYSPKSAADCADPEFESKAADILALYLNPPQHTAVFSVDEKTAIQALDRLDLVLPLSPGRAKPTALCTTGMARFRCTLR
ncbi:MAG TPA: hypothetical protein VKX41_17065 [Alloacidobacterium sp.]|nr:hypothetical protein [Alloacidobacterium sp.]